MKKVAVIFISLVLVLVLAVLGFLLPAHVQIRKLAIEIPSIEQVKATFAQLDQSQLPLGIEYINTASQDGPFGKLGHLGVLVTWPDGKQFLIDAGMNRVEAEKFGASLELLGAGKTETFGPIEEQMGGYIDNIQGIAFTHLHTDHTLGLTDVCIALSNRKKAATIFQTEHQFQLQNHFTSQGQTIVNTADCEHVVLGGDVLKAVEGFPGLFAVSAGGHTPGSTVFITKVNEKIWIFAGDLTNAMKDIEENNGKGWAYSYVLVPEDTALLARWRVWLKQVNDSENISVLVAHDINAFEGSELQHWREPEAL